MCQCEELCVEGADKENFVIRENSPEQIKVDITNNK